MKKTILLATALAIYCSAAFVACKKSDSTPAPAGSAQSTTSTTVMQGHCDCRTGLEAGTGQPCTCKLEE